MKLKIGFLGSAPQLGSDTNDTETVYSTDDGSDHCGFDDGSKDGTDDGPDHDVPDSRIDEPQVEPAFGTFLQPITQKCCDIFHLNLNQIIVLRMIEQ